MPGRGIFGFIVAEAVTAGYEDHRRRRDPIDEESVVESARHHPFRRQPGAFRGALQYRQQRFGEGCRWHVKAALEQNLATLGVSTLAKALLDHRVEPVDRQWIGMTDIN